MSNVLIIVLHVKQVHKLIVYQWVTVGFKSKRDLQLRTQKPTPTSLKEVPDAQLGSLMIKRVPLATSGNINPQEPFPKPATELQVSAKSQCIAALPSLAQPHFLSHFRRSRLQLPFMCFGFSSTWSSWQCCAEQYVHRPCLHHLLHTQPAHFIAEVEP